MNGEARPEPEEPISQQTLPVKDTLSGE